MKVHHIGYLVKNLKKSESAFLSLGYKKRGELTRDEYRGIDILFIEKDNYLVELICPYSQNSIVNNLMKKYKNSPYHMCYVVDDISLAIAEMKQLGFLPLDEPTVAPAIEGKRVCFLLNSAIGIVELLER